jgi:hypothetical protein
MKPTPDPRPAALDLERDVEPPLEDPPADWPSGLSEKNLRLLDAAFHDAGLLASEELGPPTPAEQADEAAIVRWLEGLLREP